MLLISSELPELLKLSHRILVLREGRLVGEVARAEATEEVVLRLMGGVAVGGRRSGGGNGNGDAYGAGRGWEGRS